MAENQDTTTDTDGDIPPRTPRKIEWLGDGSYRVSTREILNGAHAKRIIQQEQKRIQAAREQALRERFGLSQ